MNLHFEPRTSAVL